MKKTFKLVSLVLVFLMCATTVVACSPAKETPAAEPSAVAASDVKNTEAPKASEPSAAGDKILLGFSLFDNTQPWAVAYSTTVFAEAEARGYDYVYTDAQNDTAKQVNDVEDLLAQGIDYLVLTPIEHDASAACLEAAKKAGVPVLLWGRTSKGVAGVDYVTCITGDFIWEGKSAGEWLVKETGGKARIVEIAGTVGANAATDRAAGFASAIEGSPDMEIVASQTADFVRANGQKVMENIIQSLGKDGFDVVYAHSDEMAIGAVLAMKAAGIEPGKDIIVVSIDGEKEAVQLIKDGNINCIVTCTPIYSTTPFDVLDKVVAGETVEPWVANPGTVIDKNNVDEQLPLAF